MRTAMPVLALEHVETRARDATVTAHLQAVETAIQTMHSHLHEALTLEDLAAAACLSPAHFNRVFRQLTDIPPIEYLTALRFQRARRLLMITSLKITDICFEVGYTSVGSFTSRFTQRVGLSPRRLRQRAQAFEPTPAPPATQQRMASVESASAPGRQHLSGRIDAPAPFRGTVHVGLFTSAIPQGKPVRCAHLAAPGRYLLPNIADGVYYLRAAAVPHPADPRAALPPTETLLVGANPGPLLIQQGRVVGAPDLTLRPPRLCDPPVVIGAPLL